MNFLEDGVILINTSPSGTGIGRYADLVYHATESYGEFYSLICDRRQLGRPFPGTPVKGVYPPVTSGWYFNTLHPEIAFRDFFGTVKRSRDTEHGVRPLHYLSFGLYPAVIDDYTVVTVHDIIGIGKQEKMGKTEKRMDKILQAFMKARNVLTVSEHVKKEIQDFGFDGTITVMHNPVSPVFKPILDKGEIRAKLGIPTEKKVLLSVSSDEPRKNLASVQKASEILGDDFVVVRVGPGIKGSINFSNVDDETLNMIYNASDVLLMPSLDEGFGLPLVESFAAGLPVVASDIDVFEEVSGGAAILCEPAPEPLADSVRDAISNRDEMAAKGLERAKDFSMDRFSLHLSNYYKSIMEK